MIAENINAIRAKIAEACRRAGRKEAEITLLAVTKKAAPALVREAIGAGIAAIGENKVQEAEVKFQSLALPSTITKHFIGHLQTNKVKKAVALFDVIQSLDSMRLAKEINAQAAGINKVQECLIEIKISEEATKYGLVLEELEAFLGQIRDLKNIRCLGLMGMAPYNDDPSKARPYFKRLKKLFDTFASSNGFSVLSMGMSGDFEVAIEEGATLVRIGTAIFQE